MSAQAHSGALFQNQDLVRASDAADSLGNQQHSLSLIIPAKSAAQTQIRSVIQCAGNVIENRQIRLAVKSPCHADPLLLSSAEEDTKGYAKEGRSFPVGYPVGTDGSSRLESEAAERRFPQSV